MPNYRITPRLTNYLLEIERHKEAFHVLPVTATLITSLRETARLLSTHYSTQIEGNMLTPKEVKQVVAGKKGGFPGRERDEREVRNYFRALEYVEEQLKGNVIIDEKLIKTIHSLVLVGTQKSTPYREGQNVIRDGSSGGIVYMPPEATDAPALMKAMVDWINTEVEAENLPAPIIAALAHYQFATIHPYYDGNGRTARLLTTFILHKTGYGMKGIYALEEYYAKNLQGYYDALTIGNSHNYYGGRAEADVTSFIEYFLSGMALAFKNVREKAQELHRDQRLDSPFGQTQKLRNLSPQQRQSLSLFLQQKEVSVSDIARHLGLKSRSTYGLVKKWIDNGFLQITNTSKKARKYSLTKDWEQQLMDHQSGL